MAWGAAASPLNTQAPGELALQEEPLTGKIESIAQLQNERSCHPVFKLGMLGLAWHLSTPMAEAGGSHVLGLPRTLSDITRPVIFRKQTDD